MLGASAGGCSRNWPRCAGVMPCVSRRKFSRNEPLSVTRAQVRHSRLESTCKPGSRNSLICGCPGRLPTAWSMPIVPAGRNRLRLRSHQHKPAAQQALTACVADRLLHVEEALWCLLRSLWLGLACTSLAESCCPLRCVNRVRGSQPHPLPCPRQSGRASAGQGRAAAPWTAAPTGRASQVLAASLLASTAGAACGLWTSSER